MYVAFDVNNPSLAVIVKVSEALLITALIAALLGLNVYEPSLIFKIKVPYKLSFLRKLMPSGSAMPPTIPNLNSELNESTSVAINPPESLTKILESKV